MRGQLNHASAAPQHTQHPPTLTSGEVQKAAQAGHTREERDVKAIGTIVVAIGSIIWNAYVGSIMWGWFVVPILGLPQITVLETFVVGLVARVVSSSSSTSDDKREGETTDARILRLILTAFFAPLVALVFGWILRGFL